MIEDEFDTAGHFTSSLQKPTQNKSRISCAFISWLIPVVVLLLLLVVVVTGNCNDYSLLLSCTPKNSPCLLVGSDLTVTRARERKRKGRYGAQCSSLCHVPQPILLIPQPSVTCFCNSLHIIFLPSWMARARSFKELDGKAIPLKTFHSCVLNLKTGPPTLFFVLMESD